MPKNRITSLELDPAQMEIKNQERADRYRKAEEEDARHEEYRTEDADIIVVAFGSAARVCTKAVDVARESGIKMGLIRPITLWPFPKKALAAAAERVKGFLVVELNAGQMIEDVRLAINGAKPVEHFGTMGSGVILTPNDIVAAAQRIFGDKI